jgi:hypothetical protein
MRIRIGNHLINTEAIAYTAFDPDERDEFGVSAPVLTIAFTTDTKLYLRGAAAVAAHRFLIAEAVDVSIGDPA